MAPQYITGIRNLKTGILDRGEIFTEPTLKKTIGFWFEEKGRFKEGCMGPRPKNQKTAWFVWGDSCYWPFGPRWKDFRVGLKYFSKLYSERKKKNFVSQAFFSGSLIERRGDYWEGL